MSKRYRYLQQGKFLLSLDQTVPSAIRTVVLGYERNKLNSIGVPKTLRQGSIRAIIKDRLRLLNSANVIELPVFGNIGMAVHRGYKVFDFQRHYVTKVFAPGTDPDVARLEIRGSRHTSKIAAAPKFIEEDPGHEWYCEEYIYGVHATDPEARSGKDVREYYPAIEDCLLDLVACRPPRLIDTLTHIEQYSDTSFRNRWIDAGQDEQQINEIVKYVEELSEWLRQQPTPDRLQLVLTHGDFSLVNAVVTNSRMRFIDWEGVTFGGLYNDVIHFLFVERYYDRIDESFVDEMTEFVCRYKEAVLDRFPELREAADLDFALARRLYYLERIGLMLKRSISSNLCNVVIKSIATFRAYDQDAGDVAL